MEIFVAQKTRLAIIRDQYCHLALIQPHFTTAKSKSKIFMFVNPIRKDDKLIRSKIQLVNLSWFLRHRNLGSADLDLVPDKQIEFILRVEENFWQLEERLLYSVGKICLWPT